METSVCFTAFAPMKAGTDHQSEQLSQLLSGEPVRVLEKAGEWSLIETEHRYRGYVRTAHLKSVNSEKPENFQGFYPSGNMALNSLFASFPAFHWEESDKNCAEHPLPEPDAFSFGQKISGTAKQFLNVPYVWGGKSPFGLDCSGLVQLVFNIAGYSFPRDAWQQAETGEELALPKAGRQPEAGELLFFKRPEKRIHHVAISLGGDRYIHASEWVRANSLSPGEPDFSEDRFQTLCLVKKIRPANLQTLKSSIARLFVA